MSANTTAVAPIASAAAPKLVRALAPTAPFPLPPLLVPLVVALAPDEEVETVTVAACPAEFAVETVAGVLEDDVVGAEELEVEDEELLDEEDVLDVDADEEVVVAPPPPR